MIRIKQTLMKNNAVIYIEGVLDGETVSTLKEVCERRFKRGETVLVDLGGLDHITREGRDYLQSIHKKADLVNRPMFLKLEKSN